MSNSKKNSTTDIKEMSKMIVMAIDSLKRTKARPDQLQITNFIERKFHLKKAEISKAIQKAVADGTITRVKYRDSVTYRNSAKHSRTMQSCHVVHDEQFNSTNAKKILRELRSITRSGNNGASAKELTESLHKNCQLITYDVHQIEAALQSAVESGSVHQLSSGNYILTVGKRIVAKKTDSDYKAESKSKINDSAELANNKDKCDIEEDTKVEEKLNEEQSTASLMNSRKRGTTVMRRARPFSKRKKIKKSLGPDFVETSELGLQYLRDTYEPKCDKCNSATLNDQEEHEELLACKDCSFKAHPSCLNYSKELADRSRRSPWQCMDCKTCILCEDSGDGVRNLVYLKGESQKSFNKRKSFKAGMLICDVCDKGYHMNCLNPPLNEKPNGTWACNKCTDNKETDNTSPIESDKGSVEMDSDEVQQQEQESQSKEETVEITDEIGTVKVTVKEQNVSGKESPIKESPIEPPKKSSPVPMETNGVNESQHNNNNNNGNATDKSIENSLFSGYPDTIPNPQSWTPDDVEMFIRHIGFPEQSHLFKEQEIDGSSLLLMRRSDVLKGFEMKLGPALKIYSHIVRLQNYEY